MKWLWAAYRRGVFAHLPEFKDGMDTFQFQNTFLVMLGDRILGRGGEAWIFLGKTQRGEIPIGLAVGVPGEHKHLEPHVFWFPEASPRNKLECILKWLIDFKSDWRVDIWAKQPSWKFFDHLCKYGVLRPVGKYRDCFDDGGDGMLYHGVRKT